MKLLGWMHRKFRQNSSEPFKDLVIGNCCDDDPKGNFGNYKHQNQKEQNLRKSLDDEYEDEASGGMYELFHGFLAIGTLGSGSDPSATPAFGISVENITEKEEEVTENELKLINDELEKVLVLGADDESCGRNSHVSNGRSSHGSIITLSGKALEADATATTVCPLQGYLFGSAIELSETTTTVAKKEHRTSLGELFQKTKLAEESFGAKDDKRDAPDKSIKKKLKKIMLNHTSSRSSTTSTVDSATADRKLHKILHMFHRKVHPENSTAAQKCDKYQKNENKKKTMNEGGHNPKEDIIMIHPKRAMAKENMPQYKIQPNPLQFILGCEDSSDNKEHWIKTDADYLVLEL
ncbi:protein LAZY 1 [Cajanus cajan]|uniref:protein LAZY 1 n=1 Tax=Cajanus cajan TaxID=3821 RepID=UPI00098DA2A8|nr:protein LAZY 1 [Cajanus cajan]